MEKEIKIANTREGGKAEDYKISSLNHLKSKNLNSFQINSKKKKTKEQQWSIQCENFYQIVNCKKIYCNEIKQIQN